MLLNLSLNIMQMKSFHDDLVCVLDFELAFLLFAFLQKVTECYQFKIKYTEKGPQMDFERWLYLFEQLSKLVDGLQLPSMS